MKLILNTDGAARGNPGPAAIGGLVITPEGATLLEFSCAIGETTNNDAEYRAAIHGLQAIKREIGKKKAKKVHVTLRLDSELVVRQLNREYKIESDLLQQRFMELWNLMLDFAEVRVVHVPRKKNKKADALANEALDRNQTLL